MLAAFLVFCRVGACFMIMPGMSSARVSPRIRILAALAVAVAVSAFVAPTLKLLLANPSALLLMRLIIGELVIGAFFGLLARFYILALEFIISGVAMSIGYGGMLGANIDGFEMQSAITALISFSALLILFILNFHHLVIATLLGSYDFMPLEQFPSTRLLLVNLVDVLRESFIVALRLGSPFIGFAIIVNLTVGLLNKLSVQIPIYFISLPFVLLLGLTTLYFAIPYILSQFGQSFPSTFTLG